MQNQIAIMSAFFKKLDDKKSKMQAYKTLGLANDATDEEINRAFRKAALRWHPDKNFSVKASDRFFAAQRAYEILTNKTLSIPHQPFSITDGSQANAYIYSDFTNTSGLNKNTVIALIATTLSLLTNQPLLYAYFYPQHFHNRHTEATFAITRDFLFSFITLRELIKSAIDVGIPKIKTQIDKGFPKIECDYLFDEPEINLPSLKDLAISALLLVSISSYQSLTNDTNEDATKKLIHFAIVASLVYLLHGWKQKPNNPEPQENVIHLGYR